MGEVITHHPLMLKRWAKIYAQRYLANQDAAIRWAMSFFSKSDIHAMTPYVQRELRGKVPNKPPPSSA